ncbi:MAG: rhomboid family intramembrane serine protease [Candidatus Cryptobacteroides sp.]
MQYYRTQGGGFLNSIPPATKNLIFINILVYIATIINKDFMFKSFALFYPTSPYFHWWQLVTHMFMHGNFWHLFFNMYSLFIFGSTVERTIGTKKFLILYFVAGFGAVALHFGVMNIQTAVLAAQVNQGVEGALQAFASIKMVPTVGASGAIYGLLLSYALLHPQNRLTLIFPPITLSAKTWVIIFAVIELFTGVSGVSDGVAHFAHLGGMLFAWALISYWKKKRCLYDDYMN